MAELVTGRIQPRVDLTPMVDLAFLLITFFMLTTQLNKSNAMDVAMPDISVPTEVTDFSDQRTVTILLGADHKMVWYWGLLNNPIEGPTVTDFEKGGIRRTIMDKSKKIAMQDQQRKKGLMVIIKPSDQSSYGDLVNVLDEMKINAVKQYMMGNIDPQETNLLTAKGL
ncbi:biopolymer transporter ExbD [Olivibacter ginsenosidimutans]|uniref:Biopolymer transporter ExbD n=1 Tax=Olivibacter ginsenosidimutans TaxID=1176537 RepID=A0ABP9BFL8_9SPHI